MTLAELAHENQSLEDTPDNTYFPEGITEADAYLLGDKMSPIVQNAIDKYIELYGIHPRVVVDMGTGGARQAIGYLNAYPDSIIYAFDYDPAAIATADARLSELENVRLSRSKAKDNIKQSPNSQNAEPLPNVYLTSSTMTTFVDDGTVPIGEAQLVIAISVISHGKHADMLQAYEQAYKALEPGGVFVFSVISDENDRFANNPKKEVCYDDPDGKTVYPREASDGDILHRFSSLEDVAQDMKETGFEILFSADKETKDLIAGITEGHIVAIVHRSIEGRLAAPETNEP